jgi:hypothetical protein
MLLSDWCCGNIEILRANEMARFIELFQDGRDRFVDQKKCTIFVDFHVGSLKFHIYFILEMLGSVGNFIWVIKTSRVGRI